MADVQCVECDNMCPDIKEDAGIGGGSYEDNLEKLEGYSFPECGGGLKLV